MRLAPDRSFRIDEVQVGRYELHVRVRGAVQGRQQELATLTHEFGVAPASTSPPSAVDLGILKVTRQE